jgi:signal recognition particle subunit SRP54
MVVKIVHDELVEMLGSEGETIDLNAPAPVVIMMAGLQGSGKTTTTGKIAKRLTESAGQEGPDGLARYAPAGRAGAAAPDRRADRRRHAADHRGPGPGRDRQARRAGGKLGGHDVVMLDTAGRTHIDEPLMVEMAEISGRQSARNAARRRLR